MVTSQTDLPGGGKQDATIEFPIAQSLEELDQRIEQTYGMDVLKTLRNGDLNQAQMVDELHKYGLNGRSQSIERMYRLHKQEFDRKETLLGTTWRWTKNVASAAGNVVAAPFRWTWQSFKAHPVLTTGAIAALALGGTGAYLYYAGQLEAALTAVGAEKVAAFFTGTAAEVAPLTPVTPIVEGAGEAGLAGGTAGLEEATTSGL